MKINNGNQALKSGIWYTISNFLVKSMALISTPLFTRLLTKSQYGDYNNYLSWSNIIIIFVSLNVEASLISAKFDYKENLKKYLLSVLTLSTSSACIWLLLCNLFSKSVSSFLGLEPLYINLMIIYCMFYSAVNLFQVNERFSYKYKQSVFVALSLAFTTTILSIVFVCTMKDKLTGRILGATLPTIIIGCILYFNFIYQGRKIDFSCWKYALKVCLPYIPHLLSLTILNSTDKVMITRICGSVDNALYSVAYSCGSMVTLLMTSMNSAFSPWLGDKLSVNDFNSIRKVSKYYILSFTFLAVGIMSFAPEVLFIMGGKSYMEAKHVMLPIMMGCICQFLYTMFVNIEQFEKKTIGMAVASLAAAVLNYLLNLLLIPRYGYTAAAYTTLIGYLFLLLIHMFLVWKINYAEAYSYRFVFLVILALVILIVVMNFLYMNPILRYLFIGVYVVVFFVTIWRKKILLISLLKNKRN